MKKYRLKKEAVPFFREDFATRIQDLDVWQRYNVDEKALEEVEDAHVEFGIQKGSRTDLGGWSREDGTKFHFTIVFPSIKYQEHNKFSKGRMVRELMNRIQNVANHFMGEFYEGELEPKKKED